MTRRTRLCFTFYFKNPIFLILFILQVLILYHQWIKKNKEIKVLLQMCKRKKLHLVLPILMSLILYLSSQNKEVNAESASNVIINANSSIHDSI